MIFIKVSILGSTGSIGTQALSVVDDLRGTESEIDVVAITGNRNTALMEEQIRKYRPKLAAVRDETLAAELRIKVSDTGVKVLCGQEGIVEAAANSGADMVLSAIVGFAGLIPTLAAIGQSKDIALANKETLVTAGGIFMDSARRNNVRILPVDSEHAAIFQCLQGNRREDVHKIILTASGGPFLGYSSDELTRVTKQQALKHPNWSMGKKITIDSATMMNKGLEVLEAKWLFDRDIDDIEVVIHPESIIHSMVEYNDHSVMAQMALPSMKHPIQYAFTYPHRRNARGARLSLAKIGRMTFFEPDTRTFKCLGLAVQAGRAGGIMPTVLNAANEAAVALFLRDKIKFAQIGDIVEACLSKYDNHPASDIDDIITADREVRDKIKSDY